MRMPHYPTACSGCLSGGQLQARRCRRRWTGPGRWDQSPWWSADPRRHRGIRIIVSHPAREDNRIGVDSPSGLVEPIKGFGHIWRNEVEGLELDLQESLGWALEPEFGFETALQCQEPKTYSERTCFLLDSDGSVITLSAHAIAGNVWWLAAGR